MASFSAKMNLLFQLLYLTFLVFNGISSQSSTQPDVNVEYLKVYSVIQSRFATTLTTSRISNVKNESQQVHFSATLPEEAFITNFSMTIGQKIIFGDVQEKEKAKQTYDRAVSRGESAGLVAQKHRESNIFQISVNLGPGEQVLFNLTYQEVLKRVHSAYRHIINLQPGQPVKEISVNVEIHEQGEISMIKVPKFGPKISEKSNEELLITPTQDDILIEQLNVDNVSSALISYYLKSESANETIDGQLAILYDLRRGESGGNVQVIDGYFVHFFAPPPGLEAGPKMIIFVLDKSGSMQGTKFSQTKTAMKRILAELKDQDRFSIIMFSGEIEVWKPEPVMATKEKREEARAFVMNSNAEGATNIDGALSKAHEILKSFPSTSFTPMIIFMTDGEPTHGETNPTKIVSHISDLNKNLTLSCPIHSLAFGRGADYKLVQRLSGSNAGLARRIYEDSDADLQLAGFYHEISSPILTDLKIDYLNNSVDVSSLVKSGNYGYNFYNGSEQVVVGKVADTVTTPLPKKDEAIDPLFDVVISGKSTVARLQAERKSIVFRGQAKPMRCFGSYRRPWPPTVCPPRPWLPRPKPKDLPSDLLPASSIGGFIERMWAYLTIKKLLSDSDLGQDDQGKAKALALSLKYKFVNALTSMVVVQEDSNKTSVLQENQQPQGISYRPRLASISSHHFMRSGMAGPPGHYSAHRVSHSGGGGRSSSRGSGSVGRGSSSHSSSYSSSQAQHQKIVSQVQPKNFQVGLKTSDPILAYLESENSGSNSFRQNVALLNDIRQCLVGAGRKIYINIKAVRLDWSGSLEPMVILNRYDNNSVSDFINKMSNDFANDPQLPNLIAQLENASSLKILLLDSTFRRNHDTYILDIVRILKSVSSKLYIVHLAPLEAEDQQILETTIGGANQLILNRNEDQMKKLCYAN